MRVEFKGEIVSGDVMNQILAGYNKEGSYSSWVEFDDMDVEFACTISGGYSRASMSGPAEAPQVDDVVAFFPLGENYLILPLEDLERVSELQRLYDRIVDNALTGC